MADKEETMPPKTLHANFKGGHVTSKPVEPPSSSVNPAPKEESKENEEDTSLNERTVDEKEKVDPDDDDENEPKIPTNMPPKTLHANFKGDHVTSNPVEPPSSSVKPAPKEKSKENEEDTSLNERTEDEKEKLDPEDSDNDPTLNPK